MKNPQPKLIMQSTKGRKDNKKKNILKIYPCVLAQHKPQTQESFAAQVETLKAVKDFVSRFRYKKLKFYTFITNISTNDSFKFFDILET